MERELRREERFRKRRQLFLLNNMSYIILCLKDSYFVIIYISIIIIINHTFYVTYVRLCGEWKVRFEVFLELNMMTFSGRNMWI